MNDEMIVAADIGGDASAPGPKKPSMPNWPIYWPGTASNIKSIFRAHLMSTPVGLPNTPNLPVQGSPDNAESLLTSLSTSVSTGTAQVTQTALNRIPNQLRNIPVAGQHANDQGNPTIAIVSHMSGADAQALCRSDVSVQTAAQILARQNTPTSLRQATVLFAKEFPSEKAASVIDALTNSELPGSKNAAKIMRSLASSQEGRVVKKVEQSGGNTNIDDLHDFQRKAADIFNRVPPNTQLKILKDGNLGVLARSNLFDGVARDDPKSAGKLFDSMDENLQASVAQSIKLGRRGGFIAAMGADRISSLLKNEHFFQYDKAEWLDVSAATDPKMAARIFSGLTEEQQVTMLNGDCSMEKRGLSEYTSAALTQELDLGHLERILSNSALTNKGVAPTLGALAKQAPKLAKQLFASFDEAKQDEVANSMSDSISSEFLKALGSDNSLKLLGDKGIDGRNRGRFLGQIAMLDPVPALQEFSRWDISMQQKAIGSIDASVGGKILADLNNPEKARDLLGSSEVTDDQRRRLFGWAAHHNLDAATKILNSMPDAADAGKLFDAFPVFDLSAGTSNFDDRVKIFKGLDSEKQREILERNDAVYDTQYKAHMLLAAYPAPEERDSMGNTGREVAGYYNRQAFLEASYPSSIKPMLSGLSGTRRQELDDLRYKWLEPDYTQAAWDGFRTGVLENPGFFLGIMGDRWMNNQLRTGAFNVRSPVVGVSAGEGAGAAPLQPSASSTPHWSTILRVSPTASGRQVNEAFARLMRPLNEQTAQYNNVEDGAPPEIVSAMTALISAYDLAKADLKAQGRWS